MTRTRGRRVAVVAAAVLMGAATACGSPVGPGVPLTPTPSPVCDPPSEIAPEDLESFPGCDLEGVRVTIEGGGGGVIPAAGGAVSGAGVGDATTGAGGWEFTIVNFGEDGTLLTTRGAAGGETTWGPESALERGRADAS